MKNNGRPHYPACPYCVRPSLFETPKGKGARVPLGAMVAMRGKYWRRPADRHPRLRSFPELAYKDQWRHRIEGRGEFIERFEQFTIDVIGVEIHQSRLPPPIGNAPFFHRVDRWGESDAPMWRIYNGCRITHHADEGGAQRLTIDVHYWVSHGLIVNVRNLQTDAPPHESGADFLTITKEALEFFHVEKRGQPKVTEAKFIEAIHEAGDEVTQAAVCDALGVTDTTLRSWLSRFNLSWDEAKRRYRPLKESN